MDSYDRQGIMGEFRDKIMEEGVFEEEDCPEDAVLFDNEFPEYIEPGV